MEEIRRGLRWRTAGLGQAREEGWAAGGGGGTE